MEDRCICCGDIIPEGQQVCRNCMEGNQMNLQNMKRSELTEQIRLFNWAESVKWFVPELNLMYHVPNEGKRQQGTGAILKAAGMKKGVPDIVLPAARQGYHGLYMELKFGNGKTTKEQKIYLQQLKEEGYRATVAHGFEEAREIIRNYLRRGNTFDLVNCENAVKIFDKCEGYQFDWTPCKNCPFARNR